TEPVPVVHRNTDVLVETGRIVAVGPGLAADGADVIDATGRIVLPGFVDAHRHLWEAPLHGITTTVDLTGYMNLVNGELAPRFRPADVHIATLAGALECLDAGITTVQDYSHIQYSPEHTDAAVRGLRESGVRAVFGYGAPVYADPVPDERWATELRRVRDTHFADADLVTMALAAGGPAYGPLDTVLRDWRVADDLGLPLVLHIGVGPMTNEPIILLRKHNLLRKGILYVHGNSLANPELALIADTGGAMAIAPAVEAQMGHGAPVVNRLRAAGVVTGLGVDVVTSAAGDMFSLMRATLLSSQLSEATSAITPADVLRMATIDGATAMGLADRIGSLRPGKQADLILLNTNGLNTLGGHRDPIGTVVVNAHPGDVDTVLVAGRIVKRDGRLTRTDVGRITEDARRTAEFLVPA
ncbi:MAG TPA: amidohydrolase family protein, partial [Pseudonocardiaceae bacterium]|nr:amidohydrolase family protein [Pseudonocardiaceae bacterium]